MGSLEWERVVTVLVAYESAHASAAGIAQQIADRLLKSGLSAVARPVDQIESLRPFRAVVLGSAVHEQKWPCAAAAFLNEFEAELANVPVWLFSTCPAAETAGNSEPKVSALSHAIQIRNHRHFEGEFERGSWCSLADLFFKMCGGPSADQRAWRDVNDWTAGIARELQSLDHARERRRLHLSVRGKP